MDACEHFQFKRPPFGALPDPDCFFAAPAHAEALATLQYAALAGKSCCLVVGESGCGKTLLARKIAVSAGPEVPIFWVHGGGQSDNCTIVSVYPPGRFGRCEPGTPAEETTLRRETQLARFLPCPPLLIVDGADELPDYAWRDVIGWVGNEIRYPRPISVLLFGLPRLLETLAKPELVRLRRRIFRACRLDPFSPQLSSEYIRARICAVGGNPDRILDQAVISQIARLGRGNPALINHLCDNALLEAYSQERDHVVMDDVGNALRAMFGGRLKEHAALVARAATPPKRPALPPVRTPPARYVRAPTREPPSVVEAPITRLPPIEVEESIETRLKQFEARLSQVLRSIRQSCGRPLDSEREARVVLDSPLAGAGDGRLAARSADGGAEREDTSGVDGHQTVQAL